MRIIKDCDGDLIKGTKTPILYQDGDIRFRYHLFIWAFDWEEVCDLPVHLIPTFRYDISVRAVSLDLQPKQRLIAWKAGTKNPSNYWEVTCDLLTDGGGAILWESGGDSKPKLLQSAAEEVEHFKKNNRWAEYNYCGSLQSTMNQLRGERQ